MSFWKFVSTGVDTLTQKATNFYTDSFLDRTLSGDYQGAWDVASSWDWKGAAGSAAKTFYDAEKGQIKAPTAQGQTVKAPRTSAGSSTYKSSQTDLGYTAKVQNAFQKANQAQQGSKIQAVINQIQSRQSRGPLLQLGSPQIKVTPRSRR
jgi:hypothetical protein